MTQCVFTFCNDKPVAYVNRRCVNGHDRSQPACQQHTWLLEEPGLWLCYTCHEETDLDVPAEYVSTVEIIDA
jgi:hypothetical protein